MSERKPGWYWVKDGEGWKCAEWRDASWYVGWAKYAASDFPFDEIGNRIPTPDEPKPPNLLTRSNY